MKYTTIFYVCSLLAVQAAALPQPNKFTDKASHVGHTIKNSLSDAASSVGNFLKHPQKTIKNSYKNHFVMDTKWVTIPADVCPKAGLRNSPTGKSCLAPNLDLANTTSAYVDQEQCDIVAQLTNRPFTVSAAGIGCGQTAYPSVTDTHEHQETHYNLYSVTNCPLGFSKQYNAHYDIFYCLMEKPYEDFAARGKCKWNHQAQDQTAAACVMGHKLSQST
jgi:hypothetical protein